MIIKFLNDWYKSPDSDKSEPVYILEVGAGQGRLGYLILKKLMSMKDYFPEGVERPFVYYLLVWYDCRYVISDYTSESILKLKTHPWYSDFVSQGVVDFSIVDCESVPTVEVLDPLLSLGETWDFK